MHVPSLLCITWFHISFALNEHVDVYSYCDPTPNSDIHQDNGLYYIKPLANGPIIPVICSNGYTMIDPSLDLELQSIPAYLSSWDYSRESLDYIITNLDDTSTWRQWWLPSNSFTKFNVASQCKSCQPSMEPTIANNVVYYTDSNNFCYTSFIAGNPCAQNINEYACNKCDVGTFSTDPDDIYWEKCSALQTSADTPSLHEPQMRVNHHLIYRPVMSMTRESCTCYQLSAHEKPTKYSVHRNQLPSVTIVPKTGSDDVRITSTYIDPSIKFEPDGDANENENGNKKDCNSNVHYLSQKDFLSGTYRIRECGEYIFTEDVQCNFNAPSQSEEQADGFSANTITGERLYWYPTKEQAKGKDAEYPGLYDYEGTYSLGFFAGITIECDDVVINLNGHSFAMHRSFYLQQRFFSLIEMAAKPFFPNQGASTWGLTGVYYAHNVEIKGPGSIGLSSHHGIHGNMVSSGYIHDFDIHSFDVAGIACNGCQYVKIENMNVGPQNKDIPTLGRYTHARAFIPRLMDLNKNFGDEEFGFYGRERTTVGALCQRMVNQMDMIYNNYVFGTAYDDSDEEWGAAQKVFLNPTGWMDGGSSYGAVFSGDGAAVVGMGSRTQYTGNISMNHVEIFGIYNAVIEKIKVSVNKVGATRLILFDTLDWIAVTSSIEDGATAQYIGDAYTDCIFAIQQHITSWAFLNSLYITDAELSYVFDGDSFRGIWDGGSPAQNDQSATGCNTDIQLHSSKGAIGLRLDGAQNVDLRNLNIHDVVNWADLGANWCGLSDGPGVSNEDVDIQYGYTGTRAHGLAIDYVQGMIENVSISAIESLNGEAVAMNVYKGCDVQIDAIHVKSVGAGTKLSMMDVEQLTLPNLVPRACAIDIHNQSDVTGLTRVTQIKLNGHEKCNFIRSVQDEKSNFMHYIETHYTTAAMLTVCCAAFILISFIIITKDYFNSKQTQQHKITNEFTPLLI
eukprot:93522_1